VVSIFRLFHYKNQPHIENSQNKKYSLGGIDVAYKVKLTLFFLL